MVEFDATLASLNARCEDLSDLESKIRIGLQFEESEFEGEDCYIAYETSEIIARGKGDKALAIIAEALQEVANKHGVAIIHHGIPSNPAALPNSLNEQAATSMWKLWTKGKR